VPLRYDDRALGVLQVLDRPQRARFSLHEMELLGMFGNQAAIALDLLVSARRARMALDDGAAELRSLAGVAAALEALEGERRDAGRRLIAELERVLTAK